MDQRSSSVQSNPGPVIKSATVNVCVSARMYVKKDVISINSSETM
jgi:hypothetical protein